MFSSSVMIFDKSSVGSGTVIGFGRTSYGYKNYILTASHVVPKSGDLSIAQWNDDNKKTVYKASLLIKDDKLDLAIIESKTMVALCPARLGNNPKPLDEVYIVGNPYRISTFITKGIVSRVTKIPDIGLRIWASAQVAPGNSGGGMFDTRGKLIGVVSRVFAVHRSKGDIMVSHIGITIPVSLVRQFLKI